MKNNWDFKADNTPTMLLSIQLIKFLILLMRSSPLQESLLTCQMHFDTVDHSILLKKKLKLYGITKLTKILHASKVTYNRKQYNETGKYSKTDLKYVHFCVFYMLTTCQIYLTYQIQLCLPMILIFSLIIRTLNISLQL